VNLIDKTVTIATVVAMETVAGGAESYVIYVGREQKEMQSINHQIRNKNTTFMISIIIYSCKPWRIYMYVPVRAFQVYCK